MINSKTVTQYESIRATFMSKKHDLSDYFNNNWHCIREKWVLAFRSDLPTLYNNTNNRVETANSKLKQFIKKNSKMSDCIQGLLSYLNFKSKQKIHKDYINRTKTIKQVIGSTDEVIQSIYKTCTSYSASIVSKSYRTSLVSDCKYRQVDGEIQVFSTQDTYIVSKFESVAPTCTCLSSTNMLLPCKHIFFLRRIQNKEIFNPEMIPERWVNSKVIFI